MTADTHNPPQPPLQPSMAGFNWQRAYRKHLADLVTQFPTMAEAHREEWAARLADSDLADYSTVAG